MIPKFDFDNSNDSEQLNPDRNVLNSREPDEHIGLVVKADKSPDFDPRSSHYDSVVFSENSLNFSEAFEDEDLIRGNTKPTVVGYCESGHDGKANIYDPFEDKLLGCGRVDIENPDDSVKRKGERLYGGEPDIPKEAYGSSRFFKNSTDLLIACIALGTIILLEMIIILILIFS